MDNLGYESDDSESIFKSLYKRYQEICEYQKNEILELKEKNTQLKYKLRFSDFQRFKDQIRNLDTIIERNREVIGVLNREIIRLREENGKLRERKEIIEGISKGNRLMEKTKNGRVPKR